MALERRGGNEPPEVSDFDAQGNVRTTVRLNREKLNSLRRKMGVLSRRDPLNIKDSEVIWACLDIGEDFFDAMLKQEQNKPGLIQTAMVYASVEGFKGSWSWRKARLISAYKKSLRNMSLAEKNKFLEQQLNPVKIMIEEGEGDGEK